MIMPASPTAPDGAKAAFERLQRTLAGQTAAIDGFAARQQELHARDYTPDLAKIHDRIEAFRGAILTLNERPAMALTPEAIAAQIMAAGSQIRAADHQAWAEAVRAQAQAASELRAVTASALTARAKWRWIGGAAAGAFVLGIILCAVVPGGRSLGAGELALARAPRRTRAANGWLVGRRAADAGDQSGAVAGAWRCSATCRRQCRCAFGLPDAGGEGEEAGSLHRSGGQRSGGIAPIRSHPGD